MSNLIQALKSKTVWFAILVAVLSVLQAYVFLLPITPAQQMQVGLLLAVLVVALRFATTQPLSEK